MPQPTRAGDVLLTSEGPLGRVARVPNDRPLVLGQRLFALRGRVGVLDSGYLYYALQTERLQSQLIAHATGTTVHGIRQASLRQLELPAPAYTEQRAIAEVLGAFDDKIAANARMTRRLEALTLTLAADARPCTPLGEIATAMRRMVAPTSLSDDVVDLYSLPGFDAGQVAERVAPASIKSGKFAISSPAVLVSKLNPRIPRIWEVPVAGAAPALASTEFVVLHPLEATTAVLWALVAQPSFSESLEAKVAGTSGSHQRVKPDEVLATLIGDPASLSEGRRSEIDALRARTHAALSESVRLAATRDSLLPVLMSGALRVKDAEQLAENLT